MSLTSTDAPDVPGAKGWPPTCTRWSSTIGRPPIWRPSTPAAGDWHGASRQLDALLTRWPADLLALLVGHQIDFFLGDAANLRDRVGRSRFALDPEHPHQGFVLGMQSFGLEEAGSYQQAEDAGLAALERNADDVWAVHAVVHTYEMRGMVAEGIGFLQSREADWGSGNLFTAHNWWHLAVYLLEAGRVADALAVYDAQIHNADSMGVPWRCSMPARSCGASCSTARTPAVASVRWPMPGRRALDEPWYAFNDLHAVIALVGAGRLDEARPAVDRLAAFVSHAPVMSRHSMVSDVGLPASRAVIAYAEGRDGDVVDTLLPIRGTFQRFGGSHAQRDALQRTLLESAIRSGQLDLARALVSERLSVRPTSVYGAQRLAMVRRAGGDDAGAFAAELAAASSRRSSRPRSGSVAHVVARRAAPERRRSADEAGGRHRHVHEVVVDGGGDAVVLAVARVALGIDRHQDAFLEGLGQPLAALERRDGVAGRPDDHDGAGPGPGDLQRLGRPGGPEGAVVAVGAGLAEARREPPELRSQRVGEADVRRPGVVEAVDGDQGLEGVGLGAVAPRSTYWSKGTASPVASPCWARASDSARIGHAPA